MIDAMLRVGVRALLARRYRVRVRGLDETAARGTRGILFLPNHPALIDPIILATVLHARFPARFLADEKQIDRPVVRWLARRARVRPIPDPARCGPEGHERIRQALADCAADLRAGGCVALYPGGGLTRQRLEELGANSAVETLLRQAPDARVVLVRIRGLWGSGFSWAGGRAPRVLPVLRRGLRGLLAGAILFAPKRPVDIELIEPADLPRHAGRDALNRYLERFYHAGATPNTYVPYSLWERGGIRELPEAPAAEPAADLRRVPPATRRIVTEYLEEVTGVESIAEGTHLARDLGMDSLARADLLAWVEQEFGLPTGDPEAIRTVGDVLRAAVGEAPAGPVDLKPIPRRWFAPRSAERLRLPEGDTIAHLFLRQAARRPRQAIVADQTSGVRTYRDLLTGIFALRGLIARLPGERVGIMLPASVAADVAYLATLFAGKTPVLVNWTVGPRNLRHSLDLAGVERVLTAEALVKRVEAQGMAFGDLAGRFLFLERVGRALPLTVRLGAWLRARLNPSALERARISPVAAILFTSGSETAPKAVPLSHANILANLRDVTSVIALRGDDTLIGFLPPFHSFGLGETVLLPLCLGMPTVHHPNPTEGGMLARLAEAYGATLLMGTPTFLNGIARAAAAPPARPGPGPLAALRLAVTGAEKCGARVYALLTEQCPRAVVLEGYGITECSPIVSVNPVEAPRPFTIGRVLPSLQYAIVEESTGRRVAPGRTGMLLVRGPSVFGGYLRYDGPSPFVEFDGASWYRTGDLVSEDPDGYLTFHGRLQRFVKLGGEMISLPAIEAALAPDADAGPLLAVEATADEPPEIVLFTTVDLDRERANRRLREAGLSPLYHVRRVVRVDALPLLGTGKTDYRELKRRLAAPDEAAGAGPAERVR